MIGALALMLAQAIVAGAGGNDANALLLLHCDGTNGSTTFTDSSSSANTVTAFGNAQLDTSTQEFGTASYKGDGTSNTRIGCGSTPFNMGSGDWTIDFWINIASFSATYYIATKHNQNASPFFGPFAILTGGTGNKVLQFYASSTGTSWDIVSGANIGTIAATGAWHHVALVRHGSSFTGYLDGVGSSLATSSASLVSNAVALTFGCVGDGGGGALNGHLDEIRFSNVARWTSNFTPPTSAYS